MSELLTTLKAEITRVARKEIRGQLEALKKLGVQQRAAIAELRRRVAQLEKGARRAASVTGARVRTLGGVDVKAADAVDAADADGGTQRRFSAERLARHRAKLGLSAAAYGQLAGASGAAVYKWEQGARPRAAQLERLAALRELEALNAR